MNAPRNQMNPARFFLGQMTSLQTSQTEFPALTNAFLSAGRSVMLSLKSLCQKAEGDKNWYKDVEKDALIKFFAELRNTSVHERPIAPNVATTIELNERIFLGESITVQLFKDGKVMNTGNVESPPEQALDANEPKVHSEWRFSERPSESALELCRQYLDKLERIVQDWEAKSTGA